MPGGRWPTGGAEGGVLVSAARTAMLKASKPPAASAVKNIVFVDFINFRCGFGWFSISPRHNDAVH
jgi:hypothetical protein